MIWLKAGADWPKAEAAARAEQASAMNKLVIVRDENISLPFPPWDTIDSFLDAFYV
jgi:hypothetical protein